MADNQTQHLKIKADQMRQRAIDSGERITSYEIAQRIFEELPNMGRDQAIAAIAKIVEQIPEDPTPAKHEHVLFKITGWVKLPTEDGEEYVPADLLTTGETEMVLRRRNRRAKQEVYNTDSALKDVQIVKDWAGFDSGKTYNENRAAYIAELGGGADRDGIEA